MRSIKARLCATALLSAVVLVRADRTASAQAPVPAAPEHVSWYGDPSAPDISGVWVRADDQATPSGSKEGWQPWPPPLKDEFAATWAKRVAAAQAGKRTDDPVVDCVRPGMPRFITGMTGPLLIVQSHARLTIYRDGEAPRRIWLDGRTFPDEKSLESFPKGTSIGQYRDGNVLIETRGFKDYPIDSTGVPHSDDLKIMERYHRVDPHTLSAEVTLIDPIAYAQPLVTTVTYKLLDDAMWAPREFICAPKTNSHPELFVH
jgi:hypothetical protein